MRRARALLPLVVVFVVGCSDVAPLKGAVDTNVEAKPTAEAVASAEVRQESTVGVVPSGAAEVAAGSSEPFVDGARAEGGDGFEADTLLAVRHGVHEGFERVVLDLGSGREPAGSVPRWTLDSPRGDSLLRVYLSSADVTGVSDGVFDDGLLKCFHVVRAPEGGTFVDIFARNAFRHRVLELEKPARLAIDFKRANAPLRKPPPAEGGKTVLAEPRAGTRISDPLTVSGYSRNFEAANTVILENSAGEILTQETVASNDWTSTWGYFEATLDLPPFAGKGTLRVGTRSARDGSFEGVEIPVSGR